MTATTKLLSLVLVFCFLCLGFMNRSAWAVLIHDEPSGFRGNQWGDSPRNGPPLRFVRNLGATQSLKQVDVYERSPVGIFLNGAPISRIRYRFLDNQLESVQLSYEGRVNRDKLLQLMEERYGRLTPGERKFVGRAEWDGYETVVELSYNVETGLGSLWFISTRLNRDFASSGY